MAGPMRLSRSRRRMARERCSLVFTASSEILRHSAISMVLSCSTSRRTNTERYVSGSASIRTGSRLRRRMVYSIGRRVPRMIALRRSWRRCKCINWPSSRRNNRRTRSTSPRAAAKPCSMARPDALNVTCHLCSQSPAGTRIPLRKFVPTAFKRTARRIVFIAPRRSPDCFPIRREASTTTADSPRCPTS